jgi:hypothetical protein
MNQIEHLNAIKTKCRTNLALAEKRTPGKWGVERTGKTNWIGPLRRNEDGKINIIVAHTDRDPELRVPARNQNDADADFIAACPRNAEAGWRSTIDRIESTLALKEMQVVGDHIKTWDWCNTQLKNICAAWPIELLQ